MINRTSTKDALAASFEQLAASRAINKIKIAEITENCGVSYPMFYYYFKDMDDAVNYIFTKQFEAHCTAEPEDMDFPWLLETLSDMIEEKRNYYINVLQNSHGVNALYTQSANFILDYIRKKIAGRFEDGAIPSNLDMMLEFYICGIRTRTCDLITGVPGTDRNEIIQIYMDALPADLRPYLIPDRH